MQFYMYLFYNFCTTPQVSNDHFVHHQEFMIYCICSSVQTMQTCLTAVSYGWNNRKTQQLHTSAWFVQSCIRTYTVNHELLMINEMVFRNM